MEAPALPLLLDTHLLLWLAADPARLPEALREEQESSNFNQNVRTCLVNPSLLCNGPIW